MTCPRCNGEGVLSDELDDDCPRCWGSGEADEDDHVMTPEATAQLIEDVWGDQ